MRTDLFAHNSAASVFTNSPIASGYLYGSSSVSDIEEAVIGRDNPFISYYKPIIVPTAAAAKTTAKK